MMESAVEEKLFGFLNARKPKGITSNDVVEQVRRMTLARAGHAGTLDPMAEGVLVLGLGEARKFIRFLEDDKEYEAVMRLGQESDTLDADGTLSEPRPVSATPGQVAGIGSELVGELELAVPAYSAVHVAGKRLYELARKGESVEPPVRKSFIGALTIREIALPDVHFRVACSGGTYVRAIAAEWGRRLGCGAHLTALTRIRSGRFLLEKSHPLESLAELAREDGIGKALVPAEEALSHLPKATCTAESLHGRTLPAPPELATSTGRPVRLVRPGGGLVGIGRVEPGRDGSLAIRPERMLAENRA